MASGARLRSANQAFGRSRSGAFLITAAPAGEFTGCSYTGGATVPNLEGPVNGNVPASDGNCTCSTFPVGPVFPLETRLTMSQQKGLGWEDPPHPIVRFTGQTSGAIIEVPEHCAIQTCPGDAALPIRWEFYCVNLGATGADYVVIKAGLQTTPVLYAYYYSNGPGSPWTDGEEVLMEIAYSASTLPDPGPYNIQSVISDPNFSTAFMRFNLDRLPRWATQSVVEIAGTGSAYDGVWEANAITSEGVSYLDVRVPSYGPLGVGGTLTRNYSEEWDCWHNDSNPPGPKPEIPNGSTPQALTIGQPFFGSPEHGFTAGSYGALSPQSWEGVDIAELWGNTTSNVIQLSTVGNVPLYGMNGIYLWIEGFSGPVDNRWAAAPVVAGEGTYTFTNATLADYFRDELGNTLTIAISENV